MAARKGRKRVPSTRRCLQYLGPDDICNLLTHGEYYDVETRENSNGAVTAKMYLAGTDEFLSSIVFESMDIFRSWFRK